MKKFTAIIFALVLCFALGTVAFAATTVTTPDEFIAALSGDDGEIIFGADIDLTKKGSVGIFDITGKTINLNGYTMTVVNMGIIFEGENFTITNGSVTSTGAYALFIGNGTVLSNEDKFTRNAVLSDLVLTGGVNIYVTESLTLRNLKVTGTSYYAIWCDAASNVTVESGEYTTSAGPNVIGMSITETGMKINGGEFTVPEGKTLVLQGNYNAPVISGGTFNEDPTAYLDPDAALATLDYGDGEDPSDFAVGESILQLSETANEEGATLVIVAAGSGNIEVEQGTAVLNKTGGEIKVNGETVEDDEEVLAKNPNKKPRPEPCDHEFDENNVCKECGVKVVQYVDGKPVENAPEQETNPNTGAESSVAAAAAVAVISLAAAFVSKIK